MNKSSFIIGPCALEGPEQLTPIIECAKSNGITWLRAALFKPRTHYNSFQGLGLAGLPLLELIKEQNLKCVTEILSIDDLPTLLPYLDMVQIGARNMQNFDLLKGIGKTLALMPNAPYVMLKRGFGNTFDEWMAAAEYLIQYGIPKEMIYLCERGTRNACHPNGVTLDLGIALLAKHQGFKVMIDPSHGSRNKTTVLPLAKAAMELDFDSVMIEIHPHPLESRSDAHQAVSIDEFNRFLSEQYHPFEHSY